MLKFITEDILAKKSAVEKNKARKLKVKSNFNRREKLKKIIMDKKISQEDRFNATMKLAALPRDGSSTRVRNRCELSGRPRGFFRRVRLSRIAMRQLAANGQIPGMTKASW